MRGRCAVVPIALALSLANAGVSLGAERHEDAVGDATGDAPDIVAVTIDEPEGPLLAVTVELASEPPLAGGEESTDLLWVVLDTGPEVTLPELDGFSFATLGATLADDLETGAHLLAGDEQFWHVVDVAVDGPTITFSVDRKLLGDPTDLWLRVYSAALHGSLYTEQVDHYPEEGEPPVAYHLSREVG